MRMSSGVEILDRAKGLKVLLRFISEVVRGRHRLRREGWIVSLGPVILGCSLVSRSSAATWSCSHDALNSASHSSWSEDSVEFGSISLLVHKLL